MYQNQFTRAGVLATGALLYSIVLLSPSVNAMDMRDFLKKHENQNQEEFLESFPFQQFLEENGFGDFDSLVGYKQRLDRLGFSGDKFLYLLTQHFMESRPLEHEDFPSFIARYHLAEYINKKNRNQEMIYEMIANMLLEDLAKKLNEGLKSRKISKNHPELKALVTQLSERQFVVSIPKSDFEKLSYHLSQGNFGYILDRLVKEFFWGSYWAFGFFLGAMLLSGSLGIYRVYQLSADRDPSIGVKSRA